MNITEPHPSRAWIARLAMAVVLCPSVWSTAFAQQPSTVELSIEQAVAMGRESNLGLQADRLNLDAASHAIAAARAAFLPQVGSSLSRSSSRSVPQDFTQGAADITSEGLVVGSSFTHVLPAFGTRYDLSLNIVAALAVELQAWRRRLAPDGTPDASRAVLSSLAEVLDDTGVTPDFLLDVVEHLAPGRSMLLVLSGTADPESVRPVVERGLARGGVTLLYANVPDDAAARLGRVLGTRWD